VNRDFNDSVLPQKMANFRLKKVGFGTEGILDKLLHHAPVKTLVSRGHISEPCTQQEFRRKGSAK
jgi:hypothetical protein